VSHSSPLSFPTRRASDLFAQIFRAINRTHATVTQSFFQYKTFFQQHAVVERLLRQSLRFFKAGGIGMYRVIASELGGVGACFFYERWSFVHANLGAEVVAGFSRCVG